MRRAFSLVEVVIAVGVFSIAVVGALSLLPALARQSRESADLETAQRLPDAVAIELRSQTSAGGFDAIAAAIPIMALPLENGWALVASPDGSVLGRADSGKIASDNQRFLVELWRFSQPPLRYQANGSVLALYVRITWPYRIPTVGTPTLLADRNQFAFTVALNR
jgi:prepilin-type N-terminal cleavage/methylation domain-containing protein